MEAKQDKIKRGARKLQRSLSQGFTPSKESDSIGNYVQSRKAQEKGEGKGKKCSKQRRKTAATLTDTNLHYFAANDTTDTTNGQKRAQDNLRMSNPKRFTTRESRWRNTQQPVHRMRSYDTSSEVMCDRKNSSTLPLINVGMNMVDTPVLKIGKTLKRTFSKNNSRRSGFEGSLPSSKQPVTMSLLSTLLELMGMDPEGKTGVLFQVEASLSAKNAPSCVTTMYNKQQMKALDRLVIGMQTIRDYQERHKSATTIQTFFKTCRLRKRFKDSNTTQILAFNQAAMSLYDLECHYVNSLRMLDEKLLQPCLLKAGSTKEIMKEDSICCVFSNFRTILRIHVDHVIDLKYAMSKWPYIEGIGLILLKLRIKLKAYSEYVSNYKSAQDLFLRLTEEKNGKVLSYLQEINLSVEECTDLLSLPLYHISLLAEHTEKVATLCISNSIEETHCNQAYSMLHQTSNFVTLNLGMAEEMLQILAIQRRIHISSSSSSSSASPLCLESADRRFLLETNFSISGHKRVFFLFNDLLLIGKASRANHVKLRESVQLEAIFYEPKDESSFILKTPQGIQTITGKAVEVAKFTKILKANLPSRKRHPTFNVPLHFILKREGNDIAVPAIVTRLATEILQFVDTEGIFRISGARGDIYALKDQFDNHPPEEVDLSNSSIHIVAGALKLWLRELPEPLMKFSLYERIIELERNPPTDVLLRYKKLLMELGDHLPTLTYLMHFLQKIVANSAVNKMSASNAAIVFGPSLIKPEQETIETTLDSPLTNVAIQRFIEHYDELL